MSEFVLEMMVSPMAKMIIGDPGFQESARSRMIPGVMQEGSRSQDLLIFLMVLILPQLPFATLDSNSVGQITLRLAVLMYGCEFMIAKTGGKLIILKVSSIVSLLLIGFMG